MRFKAANELLARVPFAKGARDWREGWTALLDSGRALSQTFFSAPRRLTLLASDALATVLSLELAVWLRFEGQVPSQYLRELPVALAAAVACRLACNWAASLHRWSFRLSGLPDAVRVALAAVAGSALFMLVTYAAIPGGLPRSVYALELFLSTSAFGVIRFGPRFGASWMGDRMRTWSGAERAIIVGSGSEAELLARDLQRTPDSKYLLLGFATTDGNMVGCRIDGRPVLCHLRDLPRVIRRLGAQMVLFADPCLPAALVRETLDRCAESRVRFKIIPNRQQLERLSVAMLEDVSPEDLLPRESVAFEDAEIRALVRGRRALVTGAGGSIGSELCRQLARHGVRQLVMLDMNENALYLNSRKLAEQFPGVDVRVEVADVREQQPLLRIADRYRPEDVFHAAAHKHVPLMEGSPDEAVKNNVFGTLHVARMAQSCGAERFVLISTDKAVNPSSVMGVTKRVAEQVLLELAQKSRTRMTAVRFGNVLGSAGSVIPIFKQQIAAGGPVTVTHPDCTRYFMTIPEAVGLVLIAGLGGYGQLCILDMGEPIRIAELARNLITMAGHVPDQEIPIVYTGLRPGEKLHEELLTEQEERTQTVRNRIKVACCATPPRDLPVRLAGLRRLADDGDREGVIQALQELVPTYRPGSLAEPAPRELPRPASVVSWRRPAPIAAAAPPAPPA
ncbi:polysaccharide biosynthesis protein [Anaeromyxobacter paludicola]|uniref:Polysaccharide biosynthesis protein n=1 Tax=Anaeromyxobacter paludicola TaxID=2918171 RepID=A0ABM7X9K5_9BACT|nr:nucleoside-diphosphate sugar epimerase/dehydratase [Anaeromyxobacter paludicola]BDG08526.1 polysaccharide biosynthesis protein [Anaeromyxobacter paludicola]